MSTKLAAFVRGSLCVGLLLTIGPCGLMAQRSSSPDLDSMIESLRADARAEKVAIITQTMQLSEKDAAAFWPIYRKYEVDLAKINDRKVELLKSYTEKFDTLTDADAKTMADQAFSIQSQTTDLRKRYYKEFNKQIPATVVTKFFQLEHRLDLIVDLKIAANLPSLLVKPVAGAPAN